MLTTPFRSVYHLDYFLQSAFDTYCGRRKRTFHSCALVLVGACQCHPLTSSSPYFFRAAYPPQSFLALDHDGDDGDHDDDDEGERRAWPARAEEKTGSGRRVRRIEVDKTVPAPHALDDGIERQPC
ncbi:uncharacterized protein SCHCODRAFT_02668232 [Schizophyllum commune H4-8]|uniref:uncharacterized protein n=1 Tax=Schizophyllum commune (strain H4-8 / FGSC 9210) TaxID=578458 RepID=UPI00215E21DE|nr:uncharacterized protein SCHCODRAFT_02668232 [Schizophyllum commune H4-8]KAI5892830.1 hypothetical protein SCHCODRAFT_02668232 [Schizophyllum commune H4-8]